MRALAALLCHLQSGLQSLQHLRRRLLTLCSLLRCLRGRRMWCGLLWLPCKARSP